MKGNRNKSVGSTFRRFRHSKAGHILYDKGVLYFVLAFLIPALIMLYGFRKQKIHPFGEEQMLVIDLWHQYYPFFRVVREKLATGGSFLYSWQNGMGTNFLSLISYYAASPLNWLSVLFSEEHSRDALTFILVSKIGFSGAFFSCFLRYVYKRRDFSIVVFSTMFALCSYMLGYYWNVMWFDTIALFPLVMLGIVAVCREGRWKLYTAALALSLVSNYYVGYFTCIFSMFMFAASIIVEGKGVKDFFRKLWLMIRSSAVGIGLGAFMLVPAYYGLKLTYSINNQFPKEYRFYHKWYEITANLLSYSEPSKKEGLPNFACGMLAVALIGVFLFSAGIKLREKITASLLLGVIFVSCDLNVLSFIWHGFHSTNQIPHRFAFIFCFVLVAAAYRAYDVMTRKGIKIYQLLLLAAGPALVLLLNVWTASKTDEGFSFEGAFRSSAVITGAYILIFAAVRLFPFKSLLMRRTVVNTALAVAVFTELVSNTVIGVRTVGSSGYTSYPTANAEVQQLLDEMSRYEHSPFSRVEMTTTYTLNDSALYGYYGVSQFSSSANVSVTRLFRRLGLYASEAGNRYYYRNSTPVVNDLLGIKYIISRTGYINNSSLMALDNIGESGNVKLYRNRYPMSVGFMMNSDILTIENLQSVLPFDYQNSIIRLATGTDLNVFDFRAAGEATCDNCEVTKSGFGDYGFTVADKALSASAVYEYEGVGGAYLFGYVSGSGVKSVSVKCGEDTAESSVSVGDYPIVFPLGAGQEGTVSTVELTFDDDRSSGSYRLAVFALDRAAFEAAYAALADEQLEITEFSDTEIKGRINAQRRGILYLSIPYEMGWKIYIDGKRATSLKVLDAMLGAEIGAGEHEIRLKYSPEGFDKGLIISGAAALLMLILLFDDFSRRKKRKNRALRAQSGAGAYEDLQNNNTDDILPEVTDEEPEGHDGVPRD